MPCGRIEGTQGLALKGATAATVYHTTLVVVASKAATARARLQRVCAGVCRLKSVFEGVVSCVVLTQHTGRLLERGTKQEPNGRCSCCSQGSVVMASFHEASLLRAVFHEAGKFLLSEEFGIVMMCRTAVLSHCPNQVVSFRTA